MNICVKSWVVHFILRHKKSARMNARLWFSNTFYFHTYLGKISNLTNSLQTGWNHQSEYVCFFSLLFFSARRRLSWISSSKRMRKPRMSRWRSIRWSDDSVSSIEFLDAQLSGDSWTYPGPKIPSFPEILWSNFFFEALKPWKTNHGPSKMMARENVIFLVKCGDLECPCYILDI